MGAARLLGCSRSGSPERVNLGTTSALTPYRLTIKDNFGGCGSRSSGHILARRPRPILNGPFRVVVILRRMLEGQDPGWR
jgi:hypothetical protein